MIEVKLKDLIDSKDALEQICKNLPSDIVLTFAKLKKHIAQEIHTLEEVRVQIIKEMGEPDENGNFSVKPELMPEFTKVFSDIIFQAITIPFSKVSIERLSHVTDANVISSLLWFIEE